MLMCLPEAQNKACQRVKKQGFGKHVILKHFFAYPSEGS